MKGIDNPSYKLFLTFIKNTETMVKTIFDSQHFMVNLAAQIGMIDSMIDALRDLKKDLCKTLEKYEDKHEIN